MKKTRFNPLAASLCLAGLLAGLTSVNQLQAQTYDKTFNEGDSIATGQIAVPEPTTLALAGLGGLSVLLLRRRK